MKSLFALACVSLSLFAFGCSGTDAADVGGAPQDEGSEDALTAQLVAGAVAADIQVTPLAAQNVEAKKVTVAQDKKLKKLLGAFKKAPAGQTLPRCMPAFETKVTFRDANAKVLATLTDDCGYGTLDPKSGASVTVRITGDIRAIAEQPIVPADALWGITKVTVNQMRMHQQKEVTTPSEIAKLVGAIDGDQKIDPDKPIAKCLPTFTVGFKRKTDEVAYTAFICNVSAGLTSVTSSLTIAGEDDDHPMARGAIALDPRPYIALFE